MTEANPAPQQALGKAAGRRADIQSGFAGNIEAKLRQRPFQLQCAARHKARAGVVPRQHGRPRQCPRLL